MAIRQPLLRDHRRGHAHGGLARAAAATAARIADAVLLPVGVVGVAGAELLGDLAVVLAARIGVAHQQRDRRAGGAPSYTPLRISTSSASCRCEVCRVLPVARRARSCAKSSARDRDARRAAVDHAADRRPVGLAEGGDAQQLAEGVQRRLEQAGALQATLRAHWPALAIRVVVGDQVRALDHEDAHLPDLELDPGERHLRQQLDQRVLGLADFADQQAVLGPGAAARRAGSAAPGPGRRRRRAGPVPARARTRAAARRSRRW